LDGHCGRVWEKCGEEVKAHEMQKKDTDVSEKSGLKLCTMAKAKCLKNGEKVLDGRCGMMWEKCGEELIHSKEGSGWKMCTVAKVKCTNHGAKVLDGRCGPVWEKCEQEIKAHKMPKKDIHTRDQFHWQMCAAAKTRCMKDGEKVLDGRCGMVWEKCGEEVKTHEMQKKDIHAKDESGFKMCISANTTCNHNGKRVLDGPCGIMWEKCGEEVKAHQMQMEKMEKMSKDRSDWRMCIVAKTRCFRNGEKVLNGRCGRAWHICEKEIKAHEMQKKEANVKDCYFDKECHAKVDWDKISEIKNGFFGRLKIFKEKEEVLEKGNSAAIKEMMVKVHAMFREAGMPEDRIDFIITKWVKSTYPEALEDEVGEERKGWKMCTVAKKLCVKDGQKVFQDRCEMMWHKCGEEVKAHKTAEEEKKPDCYFDKDCHAKVDWAKITQVKEGFFARMKNLKRKEEMKEHDDAVAIKKMMSSVHIMFMEAGMPEDRVDHILVKWVKSVYPEALQEAPVQEEGAKDGHVKKIDKSEQPEEPVTIV